MSGSDGENWIEDDCFNSLIGEETAEEGDGEESPEEGEIIETQDGIPVVPPSGETLRGKEDEPEKSLHVSPDVSPNMPPPSAGGANTPRKPWQLR